MLIPPQILHDLKTERTDVLPPLPMAMRLVPIFFYLSALAAVLLVVLTVLQIGRTVGELEAARQRTAEAKSQLAEATASRSALESRAKRAADFLQWVEGSVNVQPLAVAISRSIAQKSAINELALSRGEESHRQIQLALKLQAADASQLEAILEAIRASDFRPFSAKQSQEGNRIDYEATLIRQPANGTAAVPTQAEE